MRYFNTHGPVNAQEHYIVQRSALVEQLVSQIELGKYFTIFAPRQMGKTTLLQSIDRALDALPNTLSIALSFEAYESWEPADFWIDFGEWFSYQISTALTDKIEGDVTEIQDFLDTQLFTDSRTFLRFFRRLHKLAPALKIVLVIDEFDATPQALLSPLLQSWRTLYLHKQPPHSLHSVVLIGIQNIAQLNVGRSSPFNIAYQLGLDPFTKAEVTELLAQYTAETGQEFEPGAIDLLHEQSGGQSFLVNRAAKIVTEEMLLDRTATITKDALRTALQQLVRESNYNFETIIRHAAPFEADVLRIIFGAEYPFTRNTPLVNELHLHGIIKETESSNCEVANPLYQRVLIDHFRPHQLGMQGAILANGHDFREHLVEGKLQIRSLLSQFREFMERRGREAFDVTPMPQEATGQYLLMAYLDIVVRQLGSDLFTEVNTGEGRLDLLIVHQGTRYVIETKIWRGQVSYEKGLVQLDEYLESESQAEGYYVLFHARPNVYGKLSQDELEYPTQTDSGRTVYVYLIRLGHLFKPKSPANPQR